MVSSQDSAAENMISTMTTAVDAADSAIDLLKDFHVKSRYMVTRMRIAYTTANTDTSVTVAVPVKRKTRMRTTGMRIAGVAMSKSMRSFLRVSLARTRG